MKTFIITVIALLLLCAGFLTSNRLEMRRRLAELKSTATSAQLSDSELAKVHNDSLFLEIQKRYFESVEIRKKFCCKCHSESEIEVPK